MGISENRIECHILDELAGVDGLKILVLFGSQASGGAHDGSDVDVAVLCDHKLNFDERCSIILRLEKRLRKEVDLVDLYSLNGIILKQILTKGKFLIGRGAPDLEKLLSRMIYNQTDVMPYYNRSLKVRRMRFVHG